MIIGLTGYAQSGKDTVAKILVEQYGYGRIAFADPIKTLVYKANPIVGLVANEPIYLRHLVDTVGWEEAKKNSEVRRLLQEIGVGARESLDDTVWVVAALRQMDDVTKNYVVTDVRFENEALQIKSVGGQIWRVKRPGVGAVNSHVSEHSMDDYKVDQIFANNGTLEDLEAMVKARMQGLLV